MHTATCIRRILAVHVASQQSSRSQQRWRLASDLDAQSAASSFRRTFGTLCLVAAVMCAPLVVSTPKWADGSLAALYDTGELTSVCHDGTFSLCCFHLKKSSVGIVC